MFSVNCFWRAWVYQSALSSQEHQAIRPFQKLLMNCRFVFLLFVVELFFSLLETLEWFNIDVNIGLVSMTNWSGWCVLSKCEIRLLLGVMLLVKCECIHSNHLHSNNLLDSDRVSGRVRGGCGNKALQESNKAAGTLSSGGSCNPPPYPPNPPGCPDINVHCRRILTRTVTDSAYPKLHFILWWQSGLYIFPNFSKVIFSTMLKPSLKYK